MSATITTVTDSAPGLPETQGPGSRTGAVLALARFEARELLLQIPVLVFLLLYVGFTTARLTFQDGMSDYPVLNTVDRNTQTAPLFLAVALLVCSNAAALRSRKHGTVQQFDVMAMEPWRRVLAHVLSTVPLAVLTAVVVAGEFTREALKPGAIGHGSVGELAVGPLVVLMAGITGVLLARLVPMPFAPMLFVVAAYLLMVLATDVSESDEPQVGWLSPMVFSGISGGDPVPSDLLGRPAAWHALYLLGLCAALTCAALLLSGGRTRGVKAATALALAVTAAGAIGQFTRDTAALEAARKTASTTPQKVQSCTEHDGSTYCAFPEWKGVRDDWAAVVERVRSAAGGSATEASVTVRQRIDTSGGIEVDSALNPSATPGVVTVGTRWGGNRVPEFAVGAATVLVAGTEDATTRAMCDARAVTIMWLVLGTDPTPMATFRDVRLDDSTTGSGLVLAPTNGLSLTSHQTAVVGELLARPRAEITALVKKHWSELTSARTSTAEAAKLLGVAVPQGVESCDE
ncbi:ABC transporter permease [Streptomyces phaeoluteigriseus]|uniref:ABC transporter permease n=1 Tax=Streptomyces phaeoluteigriseus TaxID=114686 RepID=A0A1V6MUC9_9ACTN|nr:ABC transporter permease [Streptomyces phaeoluteigriseus]OQD55965.1 ABC transporter permease [Streptomyces phaeoluteigriseus]